MKFSESCKVHKSSKKRSILTALPQLRGVIKIMINNLKSSDFQVRFSHLVDIILRKSDFRTVELSKIVFRVVAKILLKKSSPKET